MTEHELQQTMMDFYANLLKIKRANGDTPNKELDSQIALFRIKLSAFGLDISAIDKAVLGE